MKLEHECGTGFDSHGGPFVKCSVGGGDGGVGIGFGGESYLAEGLGVGRIDDVEVFVCGGWDDFAGDVVVYGC